MFCVIKYADGRQLTCHFKNFSSAFEYAKCYSLYSDFEIVIPYSYERTDGCVNKICNN